ncbi:MAG TPA: gephyrin-like molybdotransferase Glp [Anaerolineales bacterium]
MSEFLRLRSPENARALLLSHMVLPDQETESVPSGQALGRITAEDIMAPHGLPEFARSTVDGYAVRARDTYGASPSLPVYLRLRGEVPMGVLATVEARASECLLIHTGGMLPPGADAVVMLENTQAASVDHESGSDESESEIEIHRAAASGENVIGVGEDVKPGQVVLGAGSRLRPQEIGGLMALGLTTVLVKRKPRIAVISTGDEIVDPQTQPAPGQVRDVNSSSLAALVADAGGEPVLLGVVPDRPDELASAARTALSTSDLVIISAGSSASARDLTASTINALGEPGVIVHGVNIRPGKPTILGICGGKVVIGLPGNPVSALVVARLFVVPAILKWLGLGEGRPQPSIRAKLSVNVASQTGREDWWPMRLHRAPSGMEPEWVAEPIFSRSNLIFGLVAAQGLMCVAAEKNGMTAGEIVTVELF